MPDSRQGCLRRFPGLADKLRLTECRSSQRQQQPSNVLARGIGCHIQSVDPPGLVASRRQPFPNPPARPRPCLSAIGAACGTCRPLHWARSRQQNCKISKGGYLFPIGPYIARRCHLWRSNQPGAISYRLFRHSQQAGKVLFFSQPMGRKLEGGHSVLARICHQRSLSQVKAASGAISALHSTPWLVPRVGVVPSRGVVPQCDDVLQQCWRQLDARHKNPSSDATPPGPKPVRPRDPLREPGPIIADPSHVQSSLPTQPHSRRSSSVR